MTNPAPVGYPDWQRTFAAARQLLVNVNTHTIAVPEQFGPLTTANMRALGLNIQPTAGNVSLLFEWFLDAALTIIVTNEEVEVNQGQIFDQTISVKGPFLRITVTPIPAVATTYLLLVYESTFDSISQRISVDNILIQADFVNIPATSGTTLRPLRVWGGPAVFFVYSVDAAAWNAHLLYERPGGPNMTFLRVDNTTLKVAMPTYLPTCPVRIDINNNDAAARNFEVSLVAQPFHP